MVQVLWNSARERTGRFIIKEEGEAIEEKGEEVHIIVR